MPFERATRQESITDSFFRIMSSYDGYEPTKEEKDLFASKHFSNPSIFYKFSSTTQDEIMWLNTLTATDREFLRVNYEGPFKHDLSRSLALFALHLNIYP